MGKKALSLYQEPRLVIYDSGIGGESIFKKSKNFFKNTVFFQDQGNFPYGNKDFESLSKIFLSNLKKLSLKENDILVLACNTISCVYLDLLDQLNANYKVLYILEHVIQSVFEDRVVLCTSYTSNFLNKLNIKNLAIDNLACLIEKKDVANILKHLLNIVIHEKNVIYGCTHYPIIENILKKKYLNKNFINPEEKLILDIKKNIGLIKC
ncbi:hypothetical protein [Alphaproteobacteria bacterium endosymbiont of Tiliacea citrago]|uniref:hypothetical protein n=1 Tax=Alphaproteobacteria bacterium endosymbiont of Tiliacea citrago TaxID=3077944 RepID=UPI00313B77D1